MSLIKYLAIALISVTSTVSFAKDIVGKWRSIDDKTGFSKAIIEIKKLDNGTYSGKIIEIIPRPGYTPKASCDKCKGNLKNKPILGLEILKNIKALNGEATEYGEGTVLDPLTGREYRSTIKLNSTGSRLSLLGYWGSESFGRRQTWIRQD